MSGTKAQVSPISILLALLGVSILAIFLLSHDNRQSINTQALRYSSSYTQKQLQATLNYETPHGKIVTLLSQYICHWDEDVKTKIDETLPEVLNNLSRKNYNYILAIKNEEGYLEEPRYYNNVSSACLQSITLAKQNIKTRCTSFEVVLGTWKQGEEVDNC
ncbi:MAG: hypothetical protein GOU97_01070 [Nanoarchaeota archaeon]|nr:hypothetical protein [Nanoarchaeota archaeon]